MTKKREYTPPSEQMARKHWQSQETSVFRKPYIPDSGLSIVADKREVEAVIEAEIENGPQQLFKLKSPAQSLPDAVARTQSLIAKSRRMKASSFLKLCETPEDLILYNVLYDEGITAHQKNMALSKLADLVFRKQQEQLKQHHLIRKEEERRAEQMMAAQRMLAKRKPKEADESQ